MSKSRWGLTIALALAVSGGGQLLSAQWGQGGNGLGLNGLGPRLGENVELALELEEQLGLSAEQVGSLQALQSGIREDVDPVEAEITSLRAMIMTGEVNRVEGLTRLEDLLVQYQTVSAPYRAEVEAILTLAQHQALQTVMWETRPLPGQGSGAVRAGRGWYSGRGWGRGLGRAPGGSPGRSVALGLGRGRGLGVGRGAGRGVGRGQGLRWR